MMFGSWPGWIFIRATFSWKLESIFGFEFERALKCFRNSIFFGVILAMGESLITWNVSLLDVCIFRTFVAGIARHEESFDDSCAIRETSAMSEVAYFAAQIRFRAASVEARSIERWDAVKAIGLFRSRMKKARAEEV